MKKFEISNSSLILCASFILLVMVFALGVPSAECKSRVVVAQGVEPTVMDPDMHLETTTGNVLIHIYDPLIQRANDAKIYPCLAESWKIIDDLTVEFKLRRGIT